MALQVWLPLNGTLENKGLSNVTVTNNGATVDNNGKIGKCYSFNGSSQYIDFSSYASLLRRLSEVSICFWCYISNASSDKLFCIRGGGRHQLSLNSNEFSFRDTSNAGDSMRVISNTITVNTWTHIAICYKSGSLYIYKNGELSNSYISSSLYQLSSGINDFFIGRNVASSGTTYLNGKLNDFRIYDHALSPKEVKEISKGLILHYKLDGNDIGITIPRNGDLIPDGVELYDYILNTSDGATIPTGIIVNLNTKVESKWQLSTAGSYSLYSTAVSNQDFTAYGGTSGLNWRIGGIALDPLVSYDPTQINTIIQNYLNVTINGTVKGTYSGTMTFHNIELAIFFKEGNSGYPAAHGKLYYLKIWNGSTLVRNFLPCTYLGEPGMWDTVENKFYRNQGTGLFTLGNKITLKEYEYLEANKAPYIDTQFIPKGNTSVEMQLMALSSTQNNGFFGAYGSGWADNSYGFYGWSLEKIWNNYKNDVAVGTYTSIFPINTIHKVFKDKNTLYINNRLIRQDAYTNFTAPYTLLIFDINKSNSRCPAKMRLYYTKVWDNNTLVRDFIPVSYNGTPGLWDKVEWKFYANAGTGSFTLGPEKTVQQDAPIFYDSSGYCNHGSITGTLTTNSDSPRYTKSVGMTAPGYSLSRSLYNYIISPFKLTNPSVMSVTFWYKGTTRYRGGVFCTSADTNLTDYTQTAFHDFDSSIRSKIGSSNYDLSANWTVNGTWHHYAIVYNGSNLKFYRDASCLLTVSATGTLASFNYLAINYACAGGGLRSTDGAGYSDFRIYCTALSEDDIKELYNTSAFVTNNGVFAEYELYEDNLSDVKKRGLLETANFYENGAESGYALDTDKTRVASNYIISEDFIEI